MAVETKIRRRIRRRRRGRRKRRRKRRESSFLTNPLKTKALQTGSTYFPKGPWEVKVCVVTSTSTSWLLDLFSLPNAALYEHFVSQGIACVLEDGHHPHKVSASSWHFSCAFWRLFYFSSQKLLGGTVCNMNSGSHGHKPPPVLQVVCVN